MKKFTIILFIFTIVSCQTSKNKVESKKAYERGMALMNGNSANGTIDYSKALGLFNNAAILDPGNIESLYWKAQCEIHLGKFDDAYQTAENALNDLKNDDNRLKPYFYVIEGIVQKINGNTESADKQFKQALKIYELRLTKDINDKDALANKALMLCYMNRKGESTEFLNTVKVTTDNKSFIEDTKKSIIEFNADTVFYKIKNMDWK